MFIRRFGRRYVYKAGSVSDYKRWGSSGGGPEFIISFLFVVIICFLNLNTVLLKMKGFIFGVFVDGAALIFIGR